MRIVIIAQEEPVYFSPFLRGVIEVIPGEMVLVAIAGSRGAGSHPKTWKQKLENLYILWSIMEPYGFLRNLFIGWWQRFIRSLGVMGSIFDKRSIAGAAQKYRIPVVYTNDVDSQYFILKLKEYSPDVIINQSEFLLKEEILNVPKIGIVNRHASLLPHFRGRLASFWSHARQPPEYGVTIHFVDKEIDSGAIILQKKFEISPCASYTEVLDILFKDAAHLMLEALERIKIPGFVPLPNNYQGTQTYLFPTVNDIKEYRATLKKRRREHRE